MGFLTSLSVKQIAVGLFALSTIAIVGGQHLYIGHLNKKIEAKQAEIALLQTANAQFKLSTERQNEAIAALQAAAKKRHAKGLIAIRAAKKVSKIHRDKAASLRSSTLTGNECSDADHILSDYLMHPGAP